MALVDIFGKTVIFTKEIGFKTKEMEKVRILFKILIFKGKLCTKTMMFMLDTGKMT